MKLKHLAQILVPTLFAFTCSYSQTISLSVETGYSLHHAAVAGFTAGINFKYFNIRAGLDAHLTNKVNDGMVAKTAIGHTFNIGKLFYGTLGVGYAYLYKSADKKSLNSGELLINPELGYKIEWKEQPLALYTGYTQAGALKLILVGIRGYF